MAAAKTKKYIVVGTTIKHGKGKDGAKLYADGDEIELTDDEASTIKHHLKEAKTEGKDN